MGLGKKKLEKNHDGAVFENYNGVGIGNSVKLQSGNFV